MAKRMYEMNDQELEALIQRLNQTVARLVYICRTITSPAICRY
jgi:hypothetical protein